ncbi:hypothetical protein VNI00_012140 [Paramarasmius palmivorus]|uniref:Fungal-type protein kinase domain-containing protein n=1 Tax=Paramarasmius palmivorus TaxID=297713 RepID=A0AAW0C6Z3_9AGAR
MSSQTHSHSSRVLVDKPSESADSDQDMMSPIYEKLQEKSIPYIIHSETKVLRYVGRPLNRFDTTWELVNALKDGMEAHRRAYYKLKMLHRDVSVGNILLDKDGNGILIDWDTDYNPRHCERKGTWQFMSATMLLGTSHRQMRADDLESFFYVLCWLTLNYTSHGIAPNEVEKLMKLGFDLHLIEGGRWGSGGDIKKMGIIARDMKRTGLSPGPLQQLVCEFEDLVAVRYDFPPTEEDREYFEDAKIKVLEDPSKLTDKRAERNSTHQHRHQRQ